MNIAERCQHLEDQNEAAFPIDNPSQIWKRSTVILDVTIVIPICIPTILAKNAYPQAKKILLLSNNNGPKQTDIENIELRRVHWKGHAQTRKQDCVHRHQILLMTRVTTQQALARAEPCRSSSPRRHIVLLRRRKHPLAASTLHRVLAIRAAHAAKHPL